MERPIAARNKNRWVIISKKLKKVADGAQTSKEVLETSESAAVKEGFFERIASSNRNVFPSLTSKVSQRVWCELDIGRSVLQI